MMKNKISIMRKASEDKRLKIGFCAGLCFTLLFGMFGASADYAGTQGTDILKPAASVSVCGLKNTTVSFSAVSLEKDLGVKTGNLSGILVTDLPDVEQGTLTICGQDVQLYETISRDGLNQLSFKPQKDCTSASFSFVPLVPTNEKKCAKMTISLLDKANVAPMSSDGSIQTQQDISIQGCLSVTDENTDSLKIAITAKPQKGDVVLNGLAYTYEPYQGMTGSDSFTYTATDKYGAVSSPATVKVSIEKPQTSLAYADMSGNLDYYPALKLAQMGVITGEKIGQSYYFKPQENVTKGDFLVMLTAVTKGDGDLSPTVNTGLTNDVSLPMWIKPYVAAALRKGIISNGTDGAGFVYTAPVTKSEAAVMMENAAHIPDTRLTSSVFKDVATIPTSAVQSFVNLYSNHILAANDGYASPDDDLTRADAAGMLWNLYNYCNAHSQDLGDE